MGIKLEPPITESITILMIVAHPDDIEFGAGGSAAVWTAAGATVIYCIVTDGSAGSNKPGEDLAQLVKTRQAEQIEAAAKVGVHDVRFLGYKDGTLQPTLELRRDLTRLIREVKPHRVVIMDPRAILMADDEHGFYYINHPDHRATGEASLHAVFPSAGTRPIFPELLDEGLEPHDVKELYLNMAETSNIAVDISPVWEQKIEALLCHRSQVGEDVVPMIRRWDEETGKLVGVQFAETFQVMRFGAPPNSDGGNGQITDGAGAPSAE